MNSLHSKYLQHCGLPLACLSQVLEDLEALVQLLSARARVAEEAAAQLQQDVTAAHAAADRASNDQLASSKQADSSKKEAANAKRVCSALVSLSGSKPCLFCILTRAEYAVLTHGALLWYRS